MRAVIAAVAILMPISTASASTLAAHADATATGLNRAPQSESGLWKAAPDGTAGISVFTGQGQDGMGWIGNSNGDGGPSSVPRPSQICPVPPSLRASHVWLEPRLIINSFLEGSEAADTPDP